MKAPLLLFLIVLLGLPCLLVSQKTEDPFFKTDTLDIKQKVRIMGLPIVFYTPETKFGIGGGAQLFFTQSNNLFNNRLSNIFIDAIYTTEKQLIIDIKPQFYFNKGYLFLDAAFKYKVYPNSFWGIGNNTPDENLERYNMRTFSLRVDLLEKLPPDLNFGFRFLFENHIMIEVAEEGLLAAGDIPGSEGARISGLGVIFNLDDRNVMEAPTKGNFVQFSGEFSARVFGATFSYNKFIFDFRKYFNLGKNKTLAVQAYLESAYGDVPFQAMAWLGGGERNRGYFRGRFMDNHLYSVQAEYRWRFLPRWSMAAFISTGEVASSPRQFLDDAKYSFGGGIRFQISKKLPSLLRLDIGIGKEGNSGVYFGVNEAF